jgi:3-deoxy-7-phosphoheptulonate synthase
LGKESKELETALSGRIWRTQQGGQTVYVVHGSVPENVLGGLEVVSSVKTTKSFMLASREYSRENSLVKIGGAEFGGSDVVICAGPCAVESREQMLETARAVKRSGGTVLRGGAFKPRTSPYSFQGLGEEGLRILKEVSDEVGLPVVTEVTSPDQVALISKYADALQVGARNMQNFELLKAVGRSRLPVLLKRGISATIEEWLLAAEYILLGGNWNVILCERGIRTFVTDTRNVLDIAEVALVKDLTHLPVIVDPSHATGRRDIIPAASRAAVAAGADGLIVEVHPKPESALSDGPQSLTFNEFNSMVREVAAVARAVGRRVPNCEQLP